MRRLPLGAAVAGLICWLALAAQPAVASVADPDYEVTVTHKRYPNGELIAIHGGGWIGGTDRADALAASLEFVADWGWRVHSVDYRSGAPSLADVLAWFDRIRAQTGRPVCAWGESAGANLALLLAVKRDLDCVIAESAPTYLPEIDEPWDLPDRWDAGLVERLGALNLERFSPLLRWRAIDEPVLLGHAINDRHIPIGQSRQFAKRHDTARLVSLDPGSAPFTHVTVDGSDLERLRAAERRLLRDAVATASG